MRLRLLILGVAPLILVGAVGAPFAGADEPPLPQAPARVSAADWLRRFDAMLTPDRRADLHFLRHLGWRVRVEEGETVITVHAGRPGWRRDLRDAHAQGDLVIRVPTHPAPHQLAWFAGQLPALADSPVSRLAYQLRVQHAVSLAAGKLTRNAESGQYVFPQVLVINSPWYQCDPPSSWREAEGDGTVYVATGSSRRAIEDWYAKEAVGECYVAQWIAIYAIRYELYGPAFFDQAFAAENLAIGRPHEMCEIGYGHYLKYDRPHPYYALLIPPQYQHEDPAVMLAPYGPRAFAGTTGVMQDVRDNDLSNENFTVVSISENALRQLAEIGGFSGIERLTLEAKRLFGLTKLMLVCGAQLVEYRRRLEAALAQPIFEGLMLYIHPYGVVPLRAMVEQKLFRNNVALNVRLYANGLGDAFFRKYRADWKTRWLRGPAVVAPHPAAPSRRVPGARPAPPPAPPPAARPATPARPPSGLPPPRILPISAP